MHKMVNNIIKLIKKNTEFILYGIFGIFTAIISFFVFFICNKLIGTEFYLINNAIAWFCAITFACFTNKFFVFKSKSLEPKIFLKEILMFYSSRALSLAIEEVGLWFLIEIVNMDKFTINILYFEITGHLISKVMVGVISIVMNYLFSKFVTFSNKLRK